MSLNPQQQDFYKLNFFTSRFKDYYTHHYVSSIVNISKREFGIGTMQSKISQRHLSFSSLDAFNNYLRQTPPFYVSYSTSYFSFPDKRPMTAKQWEGSDIVYEFDSDDYDLPCHDNHNTWECKNEACSEHGYGNLKTCPKCSSQTTITEWTCDECLGKAKQDTLRLIEFLETEFKLDPSSFIISFSGAKGFHVRVTDKSILSLSKSARLQMMNYILANDLELSKLGFILEKKIWKIPSPSSSSGWAKRILTGLSSLLSSFDEKNFSSTFSLSASKARVLVSSREDILNKMYHNNILYVDFPSSEKFFQDAISYVINQTRLKIDPQSSNDLFKIMRVPNTIHGGTGFLSTHLEDKEALKNFDPFKSPVVLRGDALTTIKFTKPTPRFRLFDSFYGPFSKGEVVKLSETVVMFLVLKGVANFE